MVSSQRMSQSNLLPGLAALRKGLRSLTITGPFPAADEAYQQALRQVEQRPTQEEREAAISQAWLASSRAMHLLRAGQHPQAAQAMQEMYSQVRAAISASR